MHDPIPVDEVATEAEAKPLYIVHVRGMRGTCSIAFTTPRAALASADDLQQHGFNFVRITNAANETIPIDDVRFLAGL